MLLLLQDFVYALKWVHDNLPTNPADQDSYPTHGKENTFPGTLQKSDIQSDNRLLASYKHMGWFGGCI